MIVHDRKVPGLQDLKAIAPIPAKLQARFREAAGILRVIVGYLDEHKKCVEGCTVPKIAMELKIDAEQLDWYADNIIFAPKKRKATK